MHNKVMYLFLLAAIVSTTVSAFELRQYKSAGIVILYEPPLENAAKKLAGEYPEIRADVEKKLQWSIGFTPTVVLIREHKEFQEKARDNLVTAFAVPGENVIMIDYSRMGRTPFDLRATLAHEICHLVLHYYISDSVPRWLDEGVAQWTSGGISDILVPDEKDILKQAILSGGLLRLKDISLRFPEEPEKLLLSYEESKAFVEFIVRGYGTAKLITVLHSLKKSESVEQAVYENLSTGMDQLEQKWREGLVRKYSWPSYIADHIYGIIFFAAALATLIGYVMFRRRMKSLRDDENDDFPDEKR